MQSVSPEFETAAALPIKRRCVAKLDVLWTDPFINTGMVVTANDYNRMDDLGQEYYAPCSWHDPHLVDTRKTTPKKYLCTDGTCTSDGTYYSVPSSTAGQQNNQVGWHTKAVADSNGNFSSSPAYPAATVTFSQVRSIKVLSVVGEPTLGQYPVTFEITIYDSGGSPLFNDEYTGSAVETIIDLTDEEIIAAKSMKLTLKKWSQPNTIGRVVEFFGTVSDTFYRNDIVSIDITEERELGNGTAPTGNISCNQLFGELQNIKITRETGEEYTDPFFPNNPDSYVASSVTPNVRVRPWLGFRLANGSYEWVKMGTFWTTDFDSPENDFKISFEARDRMELLRSVKFRANEILVDTNLYEIAEFILNHAKENIPMNDLTWEIDNTLEGFGVSYAWLGRLNYMEAIAKVAEACMGHAYMNRDDVLIIESYTANSTKAADFEITRSQYYNRKQPSDIGSLKNYIIVPVAETALEEEEGEIKTTDELTISALEDDKTIDIEWGDDAVMEAFAHIKDESGVTLFKSSETYYPWGCSIVVHKATGTSGTFKIMVTGKRLLTTAISERKDWDDESILLYNRREFTYNLNPLLQRSGIADIIVYILLATYANLRRDCILDWRGNPAHEIGDCGTIPVYTPNSTGVSITDNFIVYRQRFKFDGSLRCILNGRKAVDLL